MRTSLFSFALIFIHISTATAQLKLPALFSDNMVLQQKLTTPIWGWDTPGETIKITTSWDQKEYWALALNDTRWETNIQTPKAGGPYYIIVNLDTIKNVMVGEVWIASGQSNMQRALQQSENFKEELVDAADGDFRLFYVARENTDEPKRDVYGKWVASDSVTAKTFSAVAYYFGKNLRQNLKIPVGMIHVSWGGSSVQAWLAPDEIAATPEGRYYTALFDDKIKNTAPGVIPRNHRTPSSLYNGMLKPLIPFGIRGAIWYQGESNRDQAAYYQTLFPQLIRSWRKEWHIGDFPFLFVQLAPYKYDNTSQGAWIRDIQRRCLELPNTGMAVTMDIGNPENIHPTNKLDVGKRLALWALADTYGFKNLVKSGPLYRSLEIDENQIKINFDHKGSGLMAKGGELTHFEIAGSDQVFYPARARISGDQVVVRSRRVRNPVAVRYAMGDADEPNLFNKEGLPAASFKTDGWAVAR